jgi:L-ascorbate metabolism protein UlaG (beta-lactamase superfamily)
MLEIIPEELLHRVEVSEDADLRIRFLGTAGFVFEGAGRTIVVDPFITRPGLLQTIFKPLVPDLPAIAGEIPAADDVLIGHAHHDHVMDGPALCAQTGARFIGAPSACNVARAAGLPETQIIETLGEETIECGRGRVRGLPSLHGKVYLGQVALPGLISEPPAWPPRFFHLRHGRVLNWFVDLAGVRVVHIDSADFIAQSLEGLQADVLCLCAIGRKHRPDYAAEAIRILRPRWVIPCHWDWFFDPFSGPSRLLPFVDLAGFAREIQEAGAEPVVLPTGGAFGVQATIPTEPR